MVSTDGFAVIRNVMKLTGGRILIPIATDSTNLTLKKPSDWEEEKNGECKALPVSHYDGIYYSYWQPTFLEKMKILFGVNIRVCICSERHPPIALDVEK